MGSATEYLLEAENCTVAAMTAVDPDERARHVRLAAYYRNLALELMARQAPELHGSRGLFDADACRTRGSTQA